MMLGDFEIPQAPFKPSVVIKQQNPNKTSLEMKAPEMGTIMKQKFNGEAGYMEQMGQNIPFSEDQINSSKSREFLRSFIMIHHNCKLLDTLQ